MHTLHALLKIHVSIFRISYYSGGGMKPTSNENHHKPGGKDGWTTVEFDELRSWVRERPNKERKLEPRLWRSG